MKNILLITLISLVLFSCNSDQTGQMILPSVNGKPSEVLLVLNKTYWKDSVGKEFKNILRAETPALPQDEPMFDVVQVPNSAFTKFMQAARNIIRTNVKEGLKPAKYWL